MQNVIVIEPGRRERHYWLDLWRYRELFMVLAWRDLVRPLQADGHWRGVGINPALPYHAGFYNHLRPHRRIAIGRDGALCADGLCWDVAVDFFFDGFDRGIQQPDQQCQSDQ